MLIDDRRLRAFVVLAEELSFTRSAALLGVSQQSLSEQISRLEADLDARLFSRTTRSIKLTDAGKVLYRDGISVLERLSEAEQNARRASRGETGEIAIGASNLAAAPLAAILKAFFSQYPGVKATLFESHTVQQIAALRRGEIDVCFALQTSPDDDLEAVPLHEGGFVVVTAGRGTVRSPRRLSHFSAHRWITAPRRFSPGLDEMKARLFADAGFQPASVQFVEQPTIMLALVAAGLGALVMPSTTNIVGRPGLAVTPILTDRRANLSLLVRKEATLPVLRNFLDIALAERDARGWLTSRKR